MFMYRIRAALPSANWTSRHPERVWQRAVQLADDLIYSFLPTGVTVPPSPDSRVKLSQSHLRYLDEPLRYLVDVTFIVVHVQYAVQLRVTTHSQLIVPGQTRCAFPGERLADGLAREALHLDVEELPEVAEPFDHLGGHTAVKLDIREIGLECVGAGVAGVEEHEFGFLQMARRQTLLGPPSRQVELSSVHPSSSSHAAVPPHPSLPLPASVSMPHKRWIQVAEQRERRERWVRRELQERVRAQIVFA